MKNYKMRDRRNVRPGRAFMLSASPRARRAHAPEHRWQRSLRLGAVDSADSAFGARSASGEDPYYYYCYYYHYYYYYYYY